MNHDEATRTGSAGFRPTGVGLAMTRHCMPGDHNVSQTAGGRYVRYRGIKAFACTTCADRLDAKRATKATA